MQIPYSLWEAIGRLLGRLLGGYWEATGRMLQMVGAEVYIHIVCCIYPREDCVDRFCGIINREFKCTTCRADISIFVGGDDPQGLP